MRLGIAIADRDLPDDAGVALAERAEAGGIDSFWTNETGGADACVTLGAWAARTSRITLGTGVVPLSARSTATLALAARQMEKLAPARVLLGIGVGQRKAAEDLHERAWRSPLEWTSDALDVLRGSGAPPVIVGALGPRMLGLAARKADGALLNWTTPGHARVQRELLENEAAAAGRDPAALLLCGYVRVAAGPGAEAVLARQTAFYRSLPFYREHWEAMGSPSDAEVALASTDGSDLLERLAAFDALDVVVARIVPTPAFGLDATVAALCSA